jgi:uncharacterized RDD family membrane protein YckC
MTMLGQPAGWHRDPAPRDPAIPDSLRCWDGNSWTTQTKAATKQQRARWRQDVAAAQAAFARDLVERANAGDVEAQRTLYVASVPPGASRLATPEGQRLSGWWRRAFAYWIDGAIATVITVLLSWRWIKQIAASFQAYSDQLLAAGQSGGTTPDATSLVSAVQGPVLGIAVTSMLVTLVYQTGFLKAFQATPGKMVLHISVRSVDHPGPMSCGTVLRRWAGQYGIQLFTVIPLLGQLVYSCYALVNYLWPVWDPRRQAVHDKIGRTLVVRTR